MIVKRNKESWLARHTNAVIGLVGAVLAAIAGAVLTFYLKYELNPGDGKTSSSSSHSVSASDYKQIYDFAFSDQGLNLVKSKATAFADNWSKYCNDKDFAMFQQHYQMHLSPEGLNLLKSQAQDKALELVGCSFEP